MRVRCDTEEIDRLGHSLSRISSVAVVLVVAHPCLKVGQNCHPRAFGRSKAVEKTKSQLPVQAKNRKGGQLLGRLSGNGVLCSGGATLEGQLGDAGLVQFTDTFLDHFVELPL